MCPLSTSHVILSFESSGILSKMLVIHRSNQSIGFDPSYLGLTPVPPVAHDDPGIVQGIGTSTRFRG